MSPSPRNPGQRAFGARSPWKTRIMITLAGSITLMLGLGAAVPLAADNDPNWTEPPHVLDRSLRADQEPPLLEEVWAILDRLNERGARTREAVDQLKVLGPEAIPALVAALKGQRPGGVDEGDTRRETDATDRRRKTLTKVLGAHDRRSVYAHIRASIELDGAADAIQLFDVLAQIGSSDALPLLTDLTTRIEPAFRKSPSILGGYITALRSIIERDRRSYLVLGRVWLRLTDSFRHRTISLLGGFQSSDATNFMVSRIGSEARDDILIMVELAKMPAGGSAFLDDRQMATLQRLIASDDSGTRISALNLMAAQANSEVLDEIIDLLTDRDQATKKTALKAARLISGKGFGPAPDRWRTWLASERAWIATRLPEILSTLEESDATQILPAIQELQAHKASRNEIAPAVINLMRHRNPNIRAMAISVLTNLNHRLTLPTLVDALDDSDANVKDVAWKSLRHLTGYDLPAKSKRWRETLRFKVPKKTTRFHPLR